MSNILTYRAQFEEANLLESKFLGKPVANIENEKNEIHCYIGC